MPTPGEVRQHEVAFCAQVKSWADALFADHPDWPFREATIEEYGAGTNKRQDFRILDRSHNTPILCGEVKMPGTTEGRSPYDPALMREAFEKADNIQAPYFFTWNVNTFVLFDRSKWDVPMIQRRVKEWDLGLRLTSAGDCKRPEIQARLRDEFLPILLADFAKIVQGEFVDWGMPPDEIFIRSLESHLDWPVIGTRDYLTIQCQENKGFDAEIQAWMAQEMQWTFRPDDPADWREILERAARTLCYVFCNRAIFYEAIRAKYPDTLQKLSMPRTRSHETIYEHFRKRFGEAVQVTGDYEPVFYPRVNDRVGSLIFGSSHAMKGWGGVFVSLGEYNFREIPSDILGGIFQKLISPEERHKFGQFYTDEDVVDVINAFCIRRAGDAVLDPACGSGSFLVRAYHRKAWLSGQKGGGRRHQDHEKPHQELLREIFGCDIALFAAHLATLNLAARRIEDEENYPYIARANFFEVAEHRDSFCFVPGVKLPVGDLSQREMRPVPLPDLDAIVGNPPYLRQEQIEKRLNTKRQRGEDKAAYESRQKNTKEHMQELCSALWPELNLSGRSDLHCYFWPVATATLKENGYFGFLTSSSWLDVEYGFALQGWILRNFKLLAVIESVDEPWFEDARVKTAVTILQRCADKTARDGNIVKFVRLERPLAEILGRRDNGDESVRQHSAERLVKLIESAKQPYHDGNIRIIPISQRRLWVEGVQAGRVIGAEGLTEPAEAQETDTDEASAMQEIKVANGNYVAGKWGRFLRAPDFYFRIMRDYGRRFVKLGEIADIRFGIKSGCDAFFMPRDVTEKVLSEVRKGLPWNNVGLLAPARLHEVESGKVHIVRAGDNTLHPIEAEYLRPEVHSLMQVDRPVVGAADTNRVVLWVNKEMRDLAGTYVAKYIRWGAKQTFASTKSKAVPVPERSTCASRPLWYDLTNASTGVAFWPMAQKYRHVIPGNPDGLVCNHNLFYVTPMGLNQKDSKTITPILNSTLLGLFKHFYGRYAGAEGTLKTEVIDVLLLEIPDPRGISKDLAGRLQRAFRKLSKREVTHLVDEAMLQCHSEEHMREILGRPSQLPRELQREDRRELDECVLELLGVRDPDARLELLGELYAETARYYRYQRTQDIQSMENRADSRGRRFSPEDLAGSIWDSLSDEEKGPPLIQWLQTLQGHRQTVHIPDGKAKALGAGHLFDPSGVEFRVGKSMQTISYAGIEQAALVEALTDLEIRGQVELPVDEPASRLWRRDITARLATARNRFESLAGSRTGTQNLLDRTVELLMQWYTHGRSQSQ